MAGFRETSVHPDEVNRARCSIATPAHHPARPRRTVSPAAPGARPVLSFALAFADPGDVVRADPVVVAIRLWHL